MADTSLSIALAWVEAANRQDADGLAALSGEDIEVVGPRGSARGVQVLRDWLGRAGLTLTTKRAFGRGDTIVLEQRGVWRSVETGAAAGEADVASRFVVEGGRVVAFERFDSLDAALSAAGLSPSDEVRGAA